MVLGTFGGREVAASRDGIEPPRAGDTFELVHASVFERDRRSGEEILHGVRDEDLAGSGFRRDSCADVDRDAPQTVADDLTLPGMEAYPQIDADLADGSEDRVRASEPSFHT